LPRACAIGTLLRPTSFIYSYSTHSTKIAVEAQHGLIAQVIKDVVFSMRPRGAGAPVGDAVEDAMAIG
jgi:hypothetical protein